MSLLIEWRNGHCNLNNSTLCLIALPGVGNIGKAAIDALNETNEAIEVARLHHTALPPLATLDDDGLLSPPHLTVRTIKLPKGEDIVTITGNSQPLEPQNQGIMAREILSLLQEQNITDSIVLAGMVDEATRKEIFIVPSSSQYRIDLESKGVNVRVDNPSFEAIGMAALLAPLGPVFG